STARFLVFLVDVVDDFRETLSRWLTVQENAVLEESDGRCGLVLTSEPYRLGPRKTPVRFDYLSADVPFIALDIVCRWTLGHFRQQTPIFADELNTVFARRVLTNGDRDLLRARVVARQLNAG